MRAWLAPCSHGPRHNLRGRSSHRLSLSFAVDGHFRRLLVSAPLGSRLPSRGTPSAAEAYVTANGMIQANLELPQPVAA